MMKLKQIDDNVSYAVPVPHIREVLKFLPYGHVVRVMFEMLYYTGCRVSELTNMSPQMIHDGRLYWYLGKNQNGWRSEKLPDHYLEELREYRATHRVPEKKLFGINTTTFRRYFNRDVRPHVSPAWQQKRMRPRSGALEPEYVLQLKGIRKTFQTLLYAKEWERWGAADVALEFTSKRMNHSSRGMTVRHYLENFDSLRVREMSILEPEKLIQATVQLRIHDY